MNIIEKLKLQQEVGGLVLFKEGLFLRAYNESAYILTQILKHELKIQCYQIKLHNKIWVTVCAFQEAKLSKRLPDAVKTAYGGQLAGDFDTTEFNKWHEQHCRLARAASEVTKAREKAASASFVRACGDVENVEKTSKTNKNILEITDQQLEYLQNWQKGKYPMTVDEGFIQSLQELLPIIAK